MPAATKTSDVLVIGGGIHGCAAALHLAMRGHKVRLVEKDHVGRHASGVNAGGVRRLGRDVAEVALSVAATAYWQDIENFLGDDCGYRQSRYLKVAETEAELDVARTRVAILRQRGFQHEEVVDQRTLRDLMPSVAGHCVGALHVDGDGSALPFRATQAVRRRAERLGAVIHEGEAVTDIRREGSAWLVETSSGRYAAAAVVNAAGAWGGRIAAMLRDRVRLEAHAPMLAVTAAMPAFVSAVVGALGDALSLKQYGNGTVLICGGVRGRADLDSNATTLDIAGLARFVATARRIFPVLGDATVVRVWAGIEAYTPDHLPIISCGGTEGVVHAFGFSAHGFQLAPAAGELVADLVEGRPPRIACDAFRYDRFTAT